jgi:hypothetical protein
MADARYTQLLARARPGSASYELVAGWVAALEAHGKRLDEIEGRVGAAVDRLEKVGPPDPRMVRQVAKAVMSSEERRRWITGCAVITIVGIALAGAAGWALRDSQLHKRCEAAYPQRADVCLEIWR